MKFVSAVPCMSLYVDALVSIFRFLIAMLATARKNNEKSIKNQVFFCDFGRISGVFGCLGSVLGRLGGVLGCRGDILGGLWRGLGASWGALGASWKHRGLS